MQLTVDDVYLSYLPLAHIFDRVIEELFISHGASIGFWRGVIFISFFLIFYFLWGTLLPNDSNSIIYCWFHLQDVKLLIEDIGELKPTIFCAVPRVLDRIYTGTI